jgi:hypothetical protein
MESTLGIDVNSPSPAPADAGAVAAHASASARPADKGSPSDKSSADRVAPGRFDPDPDADAKAVAAAYYALNAPGDRGPTETQFLRENVDIARDVQQFHLGDKDAGIRGNALIATHLIEASAKEDIANRDPAKADELWKTAEGNANRGHSKAGDLLELGRTYGATVQGRRDIINAHTLYLQAGQEHARLAGKALVEALDDFDAASKKKGGADNDVRQNLFDAANEAPKVASELDDSVARMSVDKSVIDGDERLAKAANMATDDAASLRKAAAAAAPLEYEAFDSANSNFKQKRSDLVQFEKEKQNGMNHADQVELGRRGTAACSAAEQVEVDAKNVINNPASMPADIEIAKEAALKAVSFLRHYTGEDRPHA